MIIGDFNLQGAVFVPLETDTPLIVDANAVLPLPVTAQRFKPVCGRDAEIINRGGMVQHDKFSFRNPLDILRQFFRKTAMKDFFRLLALKRFDHNMTVTLWDNIVKGCCRQLSDSNTKTLPGRCLTCILLL
jgi:hypothetical protein